MNLSTTIHPSNVSIISPMWGFVACIFSAAGFAVNYLPVKKYETGDGIFFQWILTNAILIGSFCVSFYNKFPTFYPLVMLGGFMWSTGNIFIVPIIKTIGLGVGFLLWSSIGMVFGWASGRFGWFGVYPQLPNNFTMNYIGFVLSAISPIMYSFVKVDIVPIEIKEEVIFDNSLPHNIQESQSIDTNLSLLELLKRSLKTKSKLIGVLLSIFSGTLFGLNFIPVTYVKNRYPNASQRDLDHILAQCSGIYLGGSLYFIIYCMIKRNKPIVYPDVILPGLLSGFLWFVAYVAIFIANEALNPAFTGPIISSLCGVISTLIAVIGYREIKGVRNFIVIIIAMVIACGGAVIIGLSKIM